MIYGYPNDNDVQIEHINNSFSKFYDMIAGINIYTLIDHTKKGVFELSKTSLIFRYHII